MDLTRAGLGMVMKYAKKRRVLFEIGAAHNDDGTKAEGVGDLGEDAGAVTDVRLRADGAAVVEVEQRRERGVHDVAAGRAPERRDVDWRNSPVTSRSRRRPA